MTKGEFMDNKTKNKPLHVLVVTTWYPNGKDKLIGNYHKLFCTAVSKVGVKVNMIYVDRQGLSDLPRYPMMKKTYVDNNDGYKTYGRLELDIGRFSMDMQMNSYVKKAEKLYKAYVRENGKPDVLHAQVTVPAGYAACKIGEKYGIPVLLTEHATYFERFFGGNEEKYARYVMKHAKVTVVGNYMVDYLRDVQGVESSVLPNIVDTAVFRVPRKPHDSSVYNIATVAGLRPGKATDDAIRAVKLLCDKNPDKKFKYTIVGEGQEEANFKALSKELDMDGIIEFVGKKEAFEIAEILSTTDTLLMPSEIETFGIPAVEALSAGVPVVCTRCKGPEGFLYPDCSEFCDVHDIEGMADAIMRMYEREKNGEIDHEDIRKYAEPFSAEAVANSAVACYEELLGRK